MPRPVHFEIHASDPPRAQRFYQAVFGWSFRQWPENPYWLVTTGEGQPGIDGGMLARSGPAPAPGTPVSAFVITMQVDDLDKTVVDVEQAGGTVAQPRHPIPGTGWLAYFHDTEGNLFGALQPDDAAG